MRFAIIGNFGRDETPDFPNVAALGSAPQSVLGDSNDDILVLKLPSFSLSVDLVDAHDVGDEFDESVGASVTPSCPKASDGDTNAPQDLEGDNVEGITLGQYSQNFPNDYETFKFTISVEIVRAFWIDVRRSM